MTATTEQELMTGYGLEVLEACVCGRHRDCPDGWHYGDELPCSCTPDCALERSAPIDD